MPLKIQSWRWYLLGYRWRICLLLFFATTINYLDRQVLSLLKPELAQIFGWSNSDYANITAVFQLSYAVGMWFAGTWIDRMGTRKGYGWAIVIWSIAAILHAVAVPVGQWFQQLSGWIGLSLFSASVIGFSLMRIVLGLGESGNFPAAIKATAEYFPQKERALATGLFNSGTNIGALLAPLTVPWISETWGWEWAFVSMGLLGFIWLFFWLRFYRPLANNRQLSETERAHILDRKIPASEQEEPQPRTNSLWKGLLHNPAAWAFVVGKFLTDGVWWFFLFWLPAFLNDQYGIRGISVMQPLSLLYGLTMIGSIGGGWLPLYFIQRGSSAFEGRRKAMRLIAWLPLIILLAPFTGSYSYWFPVIWIAIGAAAHQAWSANLFSTVSDFFPQKSVATVVGLGGMAGGLGGVMLTKVGGSLFDHYQALNHIETGYNIMFSYCAIAYIVAWVIMYALLGKFRQGNPTS